MNTRKLIFIFALFGAFACLTYSCSNKEQHEKLYYKEVKSVNKLVLASMTVSKMATINDLKFEEADGLKQTAAALLDAIKPGKRVAAYSYSTYLRAYIDLSALSPEDIKVDDTDKTVTLTLPPISTEYLGRDMEIHEEHYRVTGLRSKINATERAKIKEHMNTVLKQELESNPMFRDKLINEAKAKAQGYFSALLGKDGYSVIVNFK